MTLTPGTDTFCTLNEAETYMATLTFKAAWTAASGDPAKEAALKQAARLMGALSWKGRRATADQLLAWPRYGVVDEDGYLIDSTTTPVSVKNANAEFALRLLAKDRAADKSYSISVGSIKTPDKARALVPPSVYDLIRRFLASSPGNVKVERG